MKKIICIGEALIDMICTDRGETLSNGQHFVKKPGGAPTNVAAAVAALGGRVDMLAKVGTDPFGQHLKEVLDTFGVGTQWLLQDSRYFTTLAFVSLLHNGERDFYFSRGADGQLNTADVHGLDLEKYGFAHFGSATAFLPGPLQETYVMLLQEAIRKKLFISFDPNYRHLLYSDCRDSFIEQSWNFLRQCNFFKLSDEEALLITSCSNLEEAANYLLQQTNCAFAITLGSRGALLGYEGAIYTVPGIAVQPVDTTGAGDAFVGAVLYQLQQTGMHTAKKESAAYWQQLIALANRAGARTCEYLGAMEAFKHLNKAIFD
ncbi:MAG: carbohydrate kinase [Chitinophagaceae bacterium]|nr:carbohydrate kinase [Chitinophagaceae bacterium]